ncbi:MAG: endo-1,4-beta-xylanase [Algoriphagus sp.]|uniref:endo-1,4-beta-xylanase n=1 Tax=Algoriphagus sp. TaxID=1872435 RepID=UPI002639F581|nr:endo-1,4-beta-xylanase [Algoriphagus sp.]MDG1278865.1 endo-1,4-beta-xylanase [Algoriphagus sp.]
MKNSDRYSLFAIIGLISILIFAFQSPREYSLKEMFGESFLVGAALNYNEVNGQEERAFPVLKQHFNSISPENGLKWIKIHPEPDQYDFEFGDQYVALGEKLNAFVVGHTLAWHQQVPDWVFEKADGNPKTKAELLKTLEDHIETVVGRYKGKINGWDVVNEAIADNGEFRESKWFQIAGVDFIKTAFRKANEIDPTAELYYNDYNVFNSKKRSAILKLAQEMRAEGIRIDGIGMQGHYMLKTPSIGEIEKGILDIHEAGFKVMITELDVDVLKRPKEAIGADLAKTYEFQTEYNPYEKGLPLEIEKELSQRYADIFQLYYKHRDKISRVTFWGTHDKASWLNNWPVKGRTNYPLLFDRNLRPKAQILEAIQEIIKDTN